MGIKYVLFPGYVISQTDGDRHYIGPMQLAKLYHVDIQECTIYEPAPWWTESYYRSMSIKILGLIKLYPRNDGNYQVPGRK